MSADPQILRQLKIKTGVVTRLAKEERVYVQEVEDAGKVLDKLRAENADGADVRNAERVVKDAEQMIPRTRHQLEDALVALRDLVEAVKGDAAVAASDEYAGAVAAVEKSETAY